MVCNLLAGGIHRTILNTINRSRGGAMRNLLLQVTLLLLMVSVGHASIKVIGSGESMRLDVSSLPSSMKQGYDIIRNKCTKCHTAERIIIAIQNGVAPISGQAFDQNAAKSYGVKMMRKSGGNISKEDLKPAMALIAWLLNEAAK